MIVIEDQSCFSHFKFSIGVKGGPPNTALWRQLALHLTSLVQKAPPSQIDQSPHPACLCPLSLPAEYWLASSPDISLLPP